jgi:hypothetical protein
VSVSERDRQEIVALGEDLPRLWHAATTTSGDHKQIVRLVIKEVTQKRRCGYVWIRIIWQTDAASEHWLQRCVQSYAKHADQGQLRERIAELNNQKKMDGEIAAILNEEDSARRMEHRCLSAWFTFCGSDSGSRWSRSMARSKPSAMAPMEAIR